MKGGINLTNRLLISKAVQTLDAAYVIQIQRIEKATSEGAHDKKQKRQPCKYGLHRFLSIVYKLYLNC